MRRTHRSVTRTIYYTSRNRLGNQYQQDNCVMLTLMTLIKNELN